MFAKETYTTRRNSLKKSLGTGLLLFLGNEESGMNYEDNTYHFRQDSTFLYFFGLPYAGLAAIIDVDEDKEIIFGDELTMDHIVWMGIQPALCEKAQRVGVTETRPGRGFEEVFGKELFDHIQGQKDGVPKKPDPTAALTIVSSFGVLPEEAAYIGDSEVDLATGHAAKMQTILVSWGFRGRKALLEDGAECIVDSAEEIRKIVKKQEEK